MLLARHYNQHSQLQEIGIQPQQWPEDKDHSIQWCTKNLPHSPRNIQNLHNQTIILMIMVWVYSHKHTDNRVYPQNRNKGSSFGHFEARKSSNTQSQWHALSTYKNLPNMNGSIIWRRTWRSYITKLIWVQVKSQIIVIFRLTVTKRYGCSLPFQQRRWNLSNNYQFADLQNSLTLQICIEM